MAESSFCTVTNIKNESMRIYKKNKQTDCSSPAAPVMFAAVSPSWLCLERGWVPDEPIQRGQDGLEGWPVPAISLPALEHQRVEGRGAVVRGREAILICYRLHYLQQQSRGSVRTQVGRMFHKSCVTALLKRSQTTDSLSKGKIYIFPDLTFWSI